jgi:predicted Zn-dependent protease
VGKCAHGASIAIAIDRVGDRMDYLTHVVMHELGHLYGVCGHIPGTLMDGNSERDLWCVDATTLEEVCDTQGTCVEPRSMCE